MSYNNHAQSVPVLQVRHLPWLPFMFLTVVFFLSYHDLSFTKRGIDNYNPSPDEIIANIARSSLLDRHRIALLSLGVGAIISLVSHRAQRRLRIDGRLGWLLISFVAWVFISLIWTEDLPLSLRKVVSFGILCIAAVAVVRRLSLREIILWIFFSTTIFLAIGFFAELVLGNFTPFVSGYRFAGTTHPNSQGMQCALCLLSAVAAVKVERRWRALFWGCACIGLVFLILTGSRTALAAVVVALLTYLAAVSSRRSKIAIVCGLSILFSSLLLFLGAALLPGLQSASRLGRPKDTTGTIDSFNGRTEVWKDVGYYIRQRPLLGYGYGGFWTITHVSAISEDGEGGVGHSHSTYIEYLVTLGIVGVIVYTLSLFAGIWRAFRFYRLSRNSAYAFSGALLVFCALSGFVEYTMIDLSPLMFPCMVVLARLAFVPPQQTFWVESGSHPNVR